jgi:hypothetical protein
MLQKGDIIYIKAGYKVMCKGIPAIYYKGTHPYSKKITSGLINIGEAKTSWADIRPLRKEISELVTFAFAFKEVPLDTSILERFIKHQVPDVKAPPFLVPEGQYIVFKIEQVSTVAHAHLQTYNPELPLRNIEIAANALTSTDRHLLELVGEDLGYVVR